jgi:hypothetical protein
LDRWSGIDWKRVMMIDRSDIISCKSCSGHAHSTKQQDSDHLYSSMMYSPTQRGRSITQHRCLIGLRTDAGKYSIYRSSPLSTCRKSFKLRDTEDPPKVTSVTSQARRS